jgi:hypothetical protein
MTRILVLLALLFPVVALAQPALPEGSASAPVVTVAEPTDLAQDLYRGVTSKDWFLVAGAALSLVVLGVRWLLAKKWPKVEGEYYGIALVAALAGLGALGNAWLADERLASSVTLLGAVKVWAAAVFSYVTTKKLLAAKK